VSSPAPLIVTPAGTVSALKKALGKLALEIVESVDEVAIYIARETLVQCMTILRDECEYQQLMEIAGVDWPQRDPRFELVYCLLSLTKNHRIRVHLTANEDTLVPSVTGIWPVAGWLEREVFDLYGVLFEGNPDLRRILTDYGFAGHPFRKDFPLTGYVELRYSEEEKRVKYEPVQLAQDFRKFDFLSPWEGAEYVLPGDEKAGESAGKGATQKMTADEVKKDPVKPGAPPPGTPKTTDSPAQTGAGKAADKAATKRTVRKPKAEKPQ
jgi:NADH-quinone oxidoreductase subunit C